MKSQSDLRKKRVIKTTLVVMPFVFACFLSSCKTTEKTAENTTENTTNNWIDSITDERGVYIGQDKEVVGCYKRTGIVKIDGTYEDMLVLRYMENRGYLIVNDDGTAFFELDGEKTEYVFDSGYFYLSEDTERSDGFRYTCINGRLIINDGTMITQYLRLTDEEAASYLENDKIEKE